MKVTGAVSFGADGQATLRLQPVVPIVVQAPRDDTLVLVPTLDEVQDKVRGEAWVVHVSRCPLSVEDVKIMVSNTQRKLSLAPGPNGAWSDEAWVKLRELMSKQNEGE